METEEERAGGYRGGSPESEVLAEVVVRET